MKFTIKKIVALLMTILFIKVTAQSTNLTNQNGYQVSKSTGGFSLLSNYKNLKVNQEKKSSKESNQKSSPQLGLDFKKDRNKSENNFEFFGGQAYKGNNVPYASITDTDGNTYITGASSNENQTSGDFFTMKVGADGQILWQQREQATIYAVEFGAQIKFDNDGNVVVSGLKWNGNDMDIRLIKYTSSGNKLWETTFDNGKQGLEVPNNLSIDQFGNIYIAGFTWSGNSVDYLTLKYNSNGEKQWHKTENPNGGEFWNEATAVTSDNNGNVLVTGYSPNVEGWLNYHTIKYSQDGVKIWEQAYNYESSDPENIAPVTNSVARAIITDSDNNIYVTGTFDTYLNRIGTIKYNASGEQQWMKTYKNENDLTNGWNVEIKDNKLYVGGSHRGGFSDDGTVLISYNFDGTQNWVKETNDLIESANSELSFDTNGNIIVSSNGMTQGAEVWEQDVAARAYQYTPNGDLLGESAFVISTSTGTASMGNMAGVGTDADGNVYFSVNSYYTDKGFVFETVKSSFANTSPEIEWSSVYTNLGSPDAIMLNSFSDYKGNTLSTGSYYTYSDEILNVNYFIVKHNENGNVVWNKVFNSENGNPAEGIIGRADKNGNVYIGLIPSFEQFPKMLKIIKLSPEGTALWSKEIEWTSSVAFVLEPQTDGSVYIAGRTNQPGGSNSAVGIKLNADGSEAWKTFLPNTAGQINIGKVNNDGEFIITSSNFTSIKLNSDGSIAWTSPVNIQGQTITATDLLLAKDGSFYINGNTSQEDMLLVKLDVDGQMLWYKTFGDQANNERSYTVKSFSDGSVGMIGYSLAINGDIHNVLLKYSTEGDLVWNVTSDNMRYYNDFYIDASDKSYVLNQEIIDPSRHKIVVSLFPIASLLTVDKNGENKKETQFIGPEFSEFYPKKLIPNNNNKLLLAGTVADQSFYRGLYFLETDYDGTLDVSDEVITDKKKDVLGQNFPNPANEKTTIPFTLSEDSKVVIRLYNLQGSFITEITNASYSAGKNKVDFTTKSYPTGVYLYQLDINGRKQTKKMLIN